MSNIGSGGIPSVTVSGLASTGLSFTITFSSALGQVPALQLGSSSLTGVGGSVTVAVPTPGNVLGGFFTLAFRGAETASIAFDASEANFEEALEVSVAS